MSDYAYTVATDFTNAGGVVSLTTLNAEIRADTSLAALFVDTYRQGNLVHVVTSEELSDPQETALIAVVAAYPSDTAPETTQGLTDVLFYKEHKEVQSNSSSSLRDYVTLDIDNAPAGTYLVGISFIWHASKKTKMASFRLAVDASPLIELKIPMPDKRASSMRLPVGAHCLKTLNGNHSFTFSFARAESNVTVYAHSALITVQFIKGS